MQRLLNRLLELGRNPFGDGVHRSRYKSVTVKRTVSGHIELFFMSNNHIHRKTLRDLVSKESGFWQFVCDRGLVGMYEGFYWQNIFPLDSKEYDYTDYQYWILESSLIDVDKLEGFILDNIKI